jgi:SagB-type dehydrogenase family enzyme
MEAGACGLYLTLALVVAVITLHEPMMAQHHVPLPAPDRAGRVPYETLLDRRHSEREFADRPMELVQLAQLAWASLGRNRSGGGRTVPSAGALYPLDLYVVAGDVGDLTPGVYCYDPATHAFDLRSAGDHRGELADAAFGQRWVADAPAVLVVAAVYVRATVKYDERGVRYARMEAGLVAQNLCLQAEALDLGATFVGAFDDDAMRDVLGSTDAVEPLVVVPVGTPAR